MAKLRIIPLGGSGEIGKNMIAFEYGQNVLVVDCGVMFPENDMWGIDLVIPDYRYLLDKKDRIRGIVVTHGHEDHTGGLPYFLREVQAPIYATPLTQGLIEVKLKEHKLLGGVKFHTIRAGDSVTIGPFQVEFFHVCHSIPDGVGLAIRTPVGLVVHSGDFKFDQTPVDGWTTDFARLARLGAEGVLVLLSDSTNAERPGFTPSERVIDTAFDQAFREAKGRIIVATFASLISRIQQVVNAAVRHGRKVAIAGYTMAENARIAQKLGYLQIPPGVLIRLEEVDKLPPQQVTILATGTQGEPTSALARMAVGTHKQVRIFPGDTVIISAHPIPGNEEEVYEIINRLFQKGADVLYEKIAPVHVSGHASQEEQKLMINLVRPRYFIPIHGELRHLKRHARTAQELGIPPENIFVVENGYVLEFDRGKGRIKDRVPGGYVFVDGAGVGDVGPAVLREREALSRDGFVVAVVRVSRKTGKAVEKPEIISRGFVYVKGAKELLEEAKECVVATLKETKGFKGRAATAEQVEKALSRFFYDKIRRHPMVIPVVMEV